MSVSWTDTTLFIHCMDFRRTYVYIFAILFHKKHAAKKRSLLL